MISKDNHVKFVRFVWLAVGEEAKTMSRFANECLLLRHFFFRSMYNRTIIRFGFVISRIIKVSLRVISRSPKASCFMWLAVGEEAKQRPGLQVNVYCRDVSFFVQCIIKQYYY